MFTELWRIIEMEGGQKISGKMKNLYKMFRWKT